MGFKVLGTIFVVLCTEVLAKSKDESDTEPKEPNNTSENWMIYGPIMVAILLIISCVFSCKLRNWYRRNQIKKMSPAQSTEGKKKAESVTKKEDQVDGTEYRLLTPDYRSRTPSTHSNNLPLQTSAYRPMTALGGDARYILIRDNGTDSQTTTLTRDERV